MIDSIQFFFHTENFTDNSFKQSPDNRDFIDLIQGDVGSREGSESEDAPTSNDSYLLDCNENDQFDFDLEQNEGKVSEFDSTNLSPRKEDDFILISKLNSFQDTKSELDGKNILMEMKWYATGKMSYFSKNVIDYNYNNAEMNKFLPSLSLSTAYVEVLPDMVKERVPNQVRMNSGVGLVGQVIVPNELSTVNQNMRLSIKSGSLFANELQKRKISKIESDTGTEIYMRDYLADHKEISSIVAKLGRAYKNIVGVTVNGKPYKNIKEQI